MDTLRRGKCDERSVAVILQIVTVIRAIGIRAVDSILTNTSGSEIGGGFQSWNHRAAAVMGDGRGVRRTALGS
jgi:hypothetical protein